jgi:hypothetical protein
VRQIPEVRLVMIANRFRYLNTRKRIRKSITKMDRMGKTLGWYVLEDVSAAIGFTSERISIQAERDACASKLPTDVPIGKLGQ